MKPLLKFEKLGPHVIGGLFGGLLAGLFGGLMGGIVVEFLITAIKEMLDLFVGSPTWLLIVMPLVGLTIASLILQTIGRSEETHPPDWRTFPKGAIRADITSDIVETAGKEEHFPWRLAPIRLIAIISTVGSGAALGSESPAAYFGVAIGTFIGKFGHRWRKFLRSAAIGGGAAGVAVLMGIPLIGAAYILEIGKRNEAPYSKERVLAALVGGIVGWALHLVWDVRLIRLVPPDVPPENLLQAVITIVCIGALSGFITSLTASAIYLAKKWQASQVVRLIIGGIIAAGSAIAISIYAEPNAAFGPGGGAIQWAETHRGPPLILLLVALLRALSTIAAIAAGGCGGIFVPFITIGDIAGRFFAPVLGIGGDLAGSAGAAAGIAGGYRLPLTAIAMVMGLEGPLTAKLTCLGVITVAYFTTRLNPFKMS